MYTFGLGQFGQLGHGTFIFESRVPRLVEHFKKGHVSHVDCGENHTALITGNSSLYLLYFLLNLQLVLEGNFSSVLSNHFMAASNKIDVFSIFR